LIQLWNDKGAVILSLAIQPYLIFNSGLNGVHQYLNQMVGFYAQHGFVKFFNPLNFGKVSDLNLESASPSCLWFNAYVVAVGTVNASVHVFEWKTGIRKYLLLLGSMNPKTVPKSFVFHPSKQGCSEVVIDSDRIIASIGNLIRVYHFDF
jgi:hypothetical protein